jgi:hypothetical protein
MPGCYWVPLLELYIYTYQSSGSSTSWQIRSHKPSSEKLRELLAHYMFIPLLTDTYFKFIHTANVVHSVLQTIYTQAGEQAIELL